MKKSISNYSILQTLDSLSFVCLFCVYLFLPNYLSAKRTFVSNFKDFDFKKDESLLHAVKLLLPKNLNSIDGFSEFKVVYGGPGQSETASFSTGATSDYVNNFTGDFSYNIPLFDLDGYPINMSYSAGSRMSDESSWVGLGWSLNPGSVNRYMRGLPDEFNGDLIEKIESSKNEVNLGGAFQYDVELFGINLNNNNKILTDLTVKMGKGFNLSYGNYSGFNFSLSRSITAMISQHEANKEMKKGMDFTLGFESSIKSGSTVRTNVGLTNNTYANIKNVGLSSAYNSKQGFLALNYSVSNTIGDPANKNKQANERNSKKGSFGVSSSFYNLGQKTYFPTLGNSYVSSGVKISVKNGFDIFGLDNSVHFSGFYNNRKLANNNTKREAYGYANLHEDLNSSGLLDFNREMDGGYTNSKPILPYAFMAYDIFQVNAPNYSGSFRLYHNNLTKSYDPPMKSKGNSGSLGAEFDVTGKYGIDINYVNSNSYSGDWSNNSFKLKNPSAPFFIEASEKSVSNIDIDIQDLGSELPTYLKMKKNGLNIISENIYKNAIEEKPINTNLPVVKSNDMLYYLSNAEVKSGMGVQSFDVRSFANSNQSVNHHIGELTSLNSSGVRYVFGVPAYNIVQKDYTFSVGRSKDRSAMPTYNDNTVSYNSEIISINNRQGLQHLYLEETTPAYAHSYLLTSILYPDYIDSDHIKGPSLEDAGTYVKFAYSKIDNFKWRIPLQVSKANYYSGLLTDQSDDKGNISYGEKELWYVNQIETKNYILKFYTSKRNDAPSVLDIHGNIDATKTMLKLDSIKMYTQKDYQMNGVAAVPIQSAYFEYDYSLCKNYPLNTSAANQSGKLTLKKVYFNYQKSKKAKFSPYTFEYGFNPNYNLNHVDRWGNYKYAPINKFTNISDSLRNIEFPYVGFDKPKSDLYASSWNIKAINLPTGGRLEVDYEADDYRYVQEKEASQMLKITGFYEGNDYKRKYHGQYVNIGSNSFKNPRLSFELLPGHTSLADYFKDLKYIYFKVLMRFADIGEEYVNGYGELESYGLQDQSTGYIQLKSTVLVNESTESYTPMSMAGMQFATANLMNRLPPINEEVEDGLQALEALGIVAGSFTNLLSFFKNINKTYYKNDIGTQVVAHKSWIRVNDPSEAKLGGGHRVKEIRIYDSWKKMTNNRMNGTYYGTRYSYKDQSGNSSGVASYEPTIGNDENPHKHPLYYNVKKIGVMNDQLFDEGPFGEFAYPSPSVGYSKVIVRQINNTNQKGNGYSEYEFYTAKDFPVYSHRLVPSAIRLQSTPLNFFRTYEKVGATAGYVIHTNDMHGKPKSEKIFEEGNTEEISSISYEYQKEILNASNGTMKLNNIVQTIDRSGAVSHKSVGMMVDMNADLRESQVRTSTLGLHLNTNIIPFPALIIPIVLGAVELDENLFRSASLLKVFERHGLIERVIVKDNKSIIDTKNLAYDAVTGEVLLTEVTNEFKDKYYSLNYPAHWYYEGMGPANSTINNIKRTHFFQSYQVNSGAVGFLNLAAGNSIGDEIGLITVNNTYIKAWIIEISNVAARLIDRDGNYVQDYIKYAKVLRAGKRNLQSASMGSITLKKNPINGLAYNLFDEVIQAGFVEFDDTWNADCNCHKDSQGNWISLNPYILGVKGVYKPKTSYTLLSHRTQTLHNQNSNIRLDGVFSSYNPFYKNNQGLWEKDYANWTFVSSNENYNLNSHLNESKDALGRYSANIYGFGQTTLLAKAANSKLRNVGLDSFEDYSNLNCLDQHFRIYNGATLNKDEAHTGYFSIESGASVTFNLIDEPCESLCDLDLNVSSNGFSNENILNILTSASSFGMNIEFLDGDTNYELDNNQVIFDPSSNPYKVLVTIYLDKVCFKSILIDMNIEK